MTPNVKSSYKKSIKADLSTLRMHEENHCPKPHRPKRSDYYLEAVPLTHSVTQVLEKSDQGRRSMWPTAAVPPPRASASTLSAQVPQGGTCLCSGRASGRLRGWPRPSVYPSTGPGSPDGHKPLSSNTGSGGHRSKESPQC